MSRPVLVVLGAGPGVGAAVARRFGRDGYDVALVARSKDRLEKLGSDLRAEGLDVVCTAADLTDDTALAAAVAALGERTGRIDVMHFNPSVFRHQDPLGLVADALLEDLRLGVASLLTAARAARPFLSAGGRITATGSLAADQPWHEAASLGVQKAALRNLVTSLDTTLAPHGIRAVNVQVNGLLAQNGPFAHARVAEAIHAAAGRSDADWTAQVTFDGD